METDAKELTEQNQIKSLETTKLALQRKLERNQTETEKILHALKQEEEQFANVKSEHDKLAKEIQEFKKLQQSVEPR